MRGLTLKQEKVMMETTGQNDHDLVNLVPKGQNIKDGPLWQFVNFERKQLYFRAYLHIK